MAFQKIKFKIDCDVAFTGHGSCIRWLLLAFLTLFVYLLVTAVESDPLVYFTLHTVFGILFILLANYLMKRD